MTLIQTLFMFPCAFYEWHMALPTLDQTRRLTLRLQQHLPLKTSQVNSACFILKLFTGCLYSMLYFTGLVPSFPEVPMTTIKTITLIFCCLFLLTLALSFGYTHKMYLQGVCDINDVTAVSILYVYLFLRLLSQLKDTVLKISLSGPWSSFFLCCSLTQTELFLKLWGIGTFSWHVPVRKSRRHPVFYRQLHMDSNNSSQI